MSTNVELQLLAASCRTRESQHRRKRDQNLLLAGRIAGTALDRVDLELLVGCLVALPGLDAELVHRLRARGSEEVAILQRMEAGRPRGRTTQAAQRANEPARVGSNETVAAETTRSGSPALETSSPVDKDAPLAETQPPGTEVGDEEGDEEAEGTLAYPEPAESRFPDPDDLDGQSSPEVGYWPTPNLLSIARQQRRPSSSLITLRSPEENCDG